MKFVSLFLRPEKMAKLPVILGNLDVTIDSVAPDLTSKSSRIPARVQQTRWSRASTEQTAQTVYLASLLFLRADCVTSSYIPVKQFDVSERSSVYFEVEEFVPCIAKCSQPFTIYNNHLYVYPKHLKYDNQKSFAKVPFITSMLFYGFTGAPFTQSRFFLSSGTKRCRLHRVQGLRWWRRCFVEGKCVLKVSKTPIEVILTK